ncbi:MAG: class I SAM-dependent methyltransferase [Holophagaceae bacterium]
MKVPDSGMPDEAYWASLFDIPAILDWLPIGPGTRLAVEIGCGYGTFTLPLADAIQGTVHAFDLEPSMLETTGLNLRRAGLANVVLEHRDVIDLGTDLPEASADLVLIFNLLHFDGRRALLAEAARILRSGGVVAVIHWRTDMATPRGPAMETRPTPASILEAAAGLGLEPLGEPCFLGPYHWGMHLARV